MRVLTAAARSICIPPPPLPAPPPAAGCGGGGGGGGVPAPAPDLPGIIGFPGILGAPPPPNGGLGAIDGLGPGFGARTGGLGAPPAGAERDGSKEWPLASVAGAIFFHAPFRPGNTETGLAFASAATDWGTMGALTAGLAEAAAGGGMGRRAAGGGGGAALGLTGAGSR